jgi:hypothetical protein
MSRTPSSPGVSRRPPRRLAWAALVAVVTALALAAVPGTASAAAPTVTPLLDCYVLNGDGSVTVVLGYSSSYPNHVSIPLTNKKNYAFPESFSSQLPTKFESGTHHGVATLHLSPADLAVLSWYLEGTTLDLAPATRGAGQCSATQLPALANGAAVVLGVGLAGMAGLIMTQRARRRWAAPGPLEPADQESRHA